AKFTLSNAELAIKLNTTSSGTLEEMKSGNTTISGDYFTADEYNADEDLGKAYVASKGHTYVVIEFCIENLDRGALDIGNSFFSTPLFVSVVYNGESYDYYTTQYGAVSSNGYEWARYDSINILLQAGETSYYRCYIDIPVDADSLDDEFDLIVALPNSDDSSENFTYHVTPYNKASVQEM
ncbi:MAG: hypothetical protein K6B15_04475, partial [Parasporobacterium sp.]|nr:hypothetical protein [Parasporobacterium sp.]